MIGLFLASSPRRIKTQLRRLIVRNCVRPTLRTSLRNSRRCVPPTKKLWLLRIRQILFLPGMKALWDFGWRRLRSCMTITVPGSILLAGKN